MSAWIRGSASDWKDLSDEIIAAATGNSVDGVGISSGGTGYTVGDILSVAGGTGTITAQIEVTSVAAGVIDGVRVYNGGVYTSNPSTPNSVTGGTGSGASLTLTFQDNGWTTNRDQGTQLSAVDSVAAGGSGYSVNDIITLTGGTFDTAAQLRVTSVSGGAVTGASIEVAGDYSVIPSDPVAQGSVAPSGGSGATFNLTFEDGERHVMIEGSGGGSDEIHIGWRTLSDGGSGYYNFELHGFTGYTAALPLDEQPGISPGFHEEALAADSSGAYLVATNVSFNYFMNINPYRIILTIAVGSVYNHLYLGWGNRYATSGEYPYPLVVAGSASSPFTTTAESVKHSTLCDPWAINSNDEGPMKIYGNDGTWYTVKNRQATSATNDRVVVPCQLPGGVTGTPSLPEDRFSATGLRFSDFIYGIGTGSGGALGTSLLPTGDDDHRILLPPTIVFSDPSPQVLAELDEVFWCSAFGGITNEDRFIDDNGVAYRIFQNCNRTDIYSYVAIKEAD